MRLPADRYACRTVLTFAAALALAVPATVLIAKTPAAPVLPANGPQADYPVVVGPAYAVQGVSYTPEDVMNYDQVGSLAADSGAGITASHHTLPLPSYVEVTSLVTGRTILARVERRGPMGSTDLLALAPAALAQLDAMAGTPVRVRRVNPPEDQRAMLRAGTPAPLRMDTPMSLVEVLKRKLPGQAAVVTASTPPAAAPKPPASVVSMVATPTPQPTPAIRPATRVAAASITTAPAAAKSPASPTPRATPARPAVAPSGKFEVQAAAFASAENARAAAGKLGAKVSSIGRFYRVRTGPFASRAEAEASLAKVRAAGYSDARIQTSG